MLKRLKKRLKKRQIKKYKKIFVKITKSSKTPPFFCGINTKKWGFFDVFDVKISLKKFADDF